MNQEDGQGGYYDSCCVLHLQKFKKYMLKISQNMSDDELEVFKR